MASCSAGARSANGATPVTAMPSGNAGFTTAATSSVSTSRVHSTSRYSASLSYPTASAGPKLTLGRGEKPSVNATGSSATRNARSKARATSRCEMNRTGPRLAKRIRIGKPASPRNAHLLLAAHAEQPHRHGPAGGEVLTGALTPARGRDGRRNHVLQRVPRAHPAVVARRPPTIGEPVLGQRGLPVAPEEVAVQAGGDVIPREHFVLGAVARHVPVGVEALDGHGLQPTVEPEVLAPLLERAARTP